MHHNVEVCSINWCGTKTNTNLSRAGQNGNNNNISTDDAMSSGRTEQKKWFEANNAIASTFAEIFKKCLENGAKYQRILIKINIFTVMSQPFREFVFPFILWHSSFFIPLYLSILCVVCLDHPGWKNSTTQRTVQYPLNLFYQWYFPYYVTFTRCLKCDIHCSMVVYSCLIRYYNDDTIVAAVQVLNRSPIMPD